MSGTLKIAVICLAAILWPCSLQAQSVQFHARIKVAGFTAPVELRQSDGKSRVDVSVGGLAQTYITDRDRGMIVALTASGQSRVALVFPLDRAPGVVPLPLQLSVVGLSGTIRPIGASRINGQSCRLMEFSNYLGQAGMICVNADDIILQMTKKGRNEPLFEVLEVSMAPQDPSWFKPPADYQVAVIPGIGGASAMAQPLTAPTPEREKPH